MYACHCKRCLFVQHAPVPSKYLIKAIQYRHCCGYIHKCNYELRHQHFKKAYLGQKTTAVVTCGIPTTLCLQFAVPSTMPHSAILHQYAELQNFQCIRHLTAGEKYTANSTWAVRCTLLIYTFHLFIAGLQSMQQNALMVFWLPSKLMLPSSRQSARCSRQHKALGIPRTECFLSKCSTLNSVPACLRQLCIAKGRVGDIAIHCLHNA